MVQQCLWNKPIRQETNSIGPGSTARPFTTSYRTNECVPTIFPSLIPFFNLPPPPHTHSTSIYFISFFFLTPGHHEVFDFLSSLLCLLPSLHSTFFLLSPHRLLPPPPSPLCGGNRRCKGKGAAGLLSAHNICWRVR